MESKEKIKKQKNILICFTGSVATIKDKLLVSKFLENGFNVKLIYTNAAVQFSTLIKNPSPFCGSQRVVNESNHIFKDIKVFTLKQPINSKPNNKKNKVDDNDKVKKEKTMHCYFDKNERENWEKIGDPVLHIFLKNWADVLLISPLSANTLAKIANGFSDNLLVGVLLFQ